jgi:hypothetical protein
MHYYTWRIDEENGKTSNLRVRGLIILGQLHLFSKKSAKKGIPSAESSRSVRGLGKGVSALVASLTLTCAM